LFFILNFNLNRLFSRRDNNYIYDNDDNDDNDDEDEKNDDAACHDSPTASAATALPAATAHQQPRQPQQRFLVIGEFFFTLFPFSFFFVIHVNLLCFF